MLDLLRFAKLWDEETKKDDGHIVYDQIDITWHIETENLLLIDTGSYVDRWRRAVRIVCAG